MAIIIGCKSTRSPNYALRNCAGSTGTKLTLESSNVIPIPLLRLQRTGEASGTLKTTCYKSVPPRRTSSLGPTRRSPRIRAVVFAAQARHLPDRHIGMGFAMSCSLAQSDRPYMAFLYVARAASVKRCPGGDGCLWVTLVGIRQTRRPRTSSQASSPQKVTLPQLPSPRASRPREFIWYIDLRRFPNSHRGLAPHKQPPMTGVHHPMQPSGEVGRFEKDDQPSPPADR